MDIIVTVPDTVVPRILAAYSTGGGKGLALTDVQAALKAYLQSQVASFEAGQAQYQKTQSVTGETW